MQQLSTDIERDFTWAAVDVEIQAALPPDGRSAHVKGHEALLLRQINGKWKIVRHHSIRQFMSKT